MSFLKSIGKAIAVGAESITHWLPSGFAGGGLTEVVKAIVVIEHALDGKSGAEKFRAASRIVGSLVRSSEIVLGKEIADETLLQKGIDGITQGVVDVLNSLKPAI